MQTESRFQQECAIWFNNTFRDEVGRLILLHNTPQNEIQGTKLKGMGLHKGTADFLYLMPVGKDEFLELKIDSGVQGRFQIWFESVVTVFGNPYHLIWSLEAFKQYIHSKGRLSSKLPVYPIKKDAKRF